jgi:hypothetical protein
MPRPTALTAAMPKDKRRCSPPTPTSLLSEDDKRKIMIASLRYPDAFAKIDGSWYFAERKLLLDWSETRPCSPGT